MDIPEITESEKMDRFSRGLKPEIWEYICTKGYSSLDHMITDAHKVESAKRGILHTQEFIPVAAPQPQISSEPVPMELGSLDAKPPKMTPSERERCMRKGLCLRCRQPGHIASQCPHFF